jgi:hypothetical protein
MVKVVINSCHGGFGLSNEAFEMFLDRKGIAWEKEKEQRMVFYYHAGHLGVEDKYISPREIINNRSDHDLVDIVEKLGQKADGFCASLKVIEVPDDVKWDINEYDGREWVAEKHRIWE